MTWLFLSQVNFMPFFKLLIGYWFGNALLFVRIVSQRCSLWEKFVDHRNKITKQCCYCRCFMSICIVYAHFVTDICHSSLCLLVLFIVQLINCLTGAC